MSARAIRGHVGFTLVEVLVSTAILSIMLFMVFYLLDQSSKTIINSRSKMSAFQEARAAFESITRKASQATLNTYLDYYDSAGKRPIDLPESQRPNFVPQDFLRTSELHFRTGQAKSMLPPSITTQSHAIFFQAPLGYSTTAGEGELTSSLNAKGFFIAHSDANARRPSFITVTDSRPRFQLMEYWEPTEKMSVYSGLSQNPSMSETIQWFFSPLASPETYRNQARVLADNVIALILWPRREWGDASIKGITQRDYTYDTRQYLYSNSGDVDLTRKSRNQLPPVLRISLVTIDEASAVRLQATHAGSTAKLPFLPPTLFTDLGNSSDLQTQSAALEADLRTLENILKAERVNYRIFNSDVPIRQAKWSE
jgi:uncharacterized protein (TIGR02599 family)